MPGFVAKEKRLTAATNSLVLLGGVEFSVAFVALEGAEQSHGHVKNLVVFLQSRPAVPALQGHRQALVTFVT